MREEWLAHGYDQSTYDHRLLLLNTIARHKFESVLDVGAASGPDMMLLRIYKPDAVLIGFDLAPENVTQAQGKELDVYEADLYTELPKIADKSYDVVLSNGVMMYVERKCIKELVRIARNAVILSERDYDGGILKYIEEDLGLAVKVTKVDEATRDSWKKDGFIYEITLTPCTTNQD